MTPLRVIFMGTAELSCYSLRALLDSAEVHVLAAVTQPDRPKGRDLRVQPSPVKVLAASRSLPVLQPDRARDPEFLGQMRGLAPDLIAVAAYGQILPKELLDLPRFGCINVHTSLLPKYRGAAPIQWAILNDETETGVTIMQMDAGLDTGNILTQENTPIRREDDAQTLHDRLASLGAALLVRTIPDYVAGRIQPVPQLADKACYAPKIKKEDGHIRWTEPSRAVWNRVRGLVPWPGAFTFVREQERRHLLKIWKVEEVEASGPPGQVLGAEGRGIVVACGKAAVRILEVQREGGRRVTAQQFLAGHHLRVGEALE